MGLIPVTLPRPEEPPQSIPFAPWNDVNVKMGNTLAHSIVESHERTLGIQDLFDDARQHLDVDEQRPDQ